MKKRILCIASSLIVAAGTMTVYSGYNSVSCDAYPSETNNNSSVACDIYDEQACYTEISVVVNGSYVSFDTEPQIMNGTTMVPLRSIFNALGADVNWNSITKTAEASLNGRSVSITVDSNIGYVNGEAIRLDVPAVIIENRTLIPVRFIAEGLGASVDWNANTKTVIISSK